MSESIYNPFPTFGYNGPEHFWSREEETKQLLEGVNAGKLVVVSGIHGVGKTTLTTHCGNLYEQTKGQVCYRVSLKPAMNMGDFICRLAASTVARLDENHLKLMRELANYFTHLRPLISYDQISGSPKISFSLDDNYKAEHTLDQLLDYLNRQSTQFLLVFDDAQQLMGFPEKQVFSLLVRLLKQYKSLHPVIVTDSDQAVRVMETAIAAESIAAVQIRLGMIDYDVINQCIQQRFITASRKMPTGIVEMFIDWTRQHTATTLLICNRLFASGIKAPDQWFLERVMADAMSEQDAVYYTFRRLLTDNQWLLLRAIAREKGARQVLGAEFIRKYHLGSTSSVQTALAALQDKELIVQEEGRFWIQDVLLSRWLEQD